MSRPTLHLTNWSSRKFHHGLCFTIMAAPRRWEIGEGIVRVLAPNDELFGLMRETVRARRVSADTNAIDTYRLAFEARCQNNDLSPGRLMVSIWHEYGARWEDQPLMDGGTLCCACARHSPCHRRWAAPFLLRAGWRVILDGEEVEPS